MVFYALKDREDRRPEGVSMKSYRAVRRKRRCSHRKLLLVVMLTLTAGGAVAFAGFIQADAWSLILRNWQRIRAEVLVYENGD